MNRIIGTTVLLSLILGAPIVAAEPTEATADKRVTTETFGARTLEIDQVETGVAQGKVICASQPLVVERQGVWYNPGDPRAQECDLFEYREKGLTPQSGRDAFLAIGFADPSGEAVMKGGSLIKYPVGHQPVVREYTREVGGVNEYCVEVTMPEGAAFRLQGEGTNQQQSSGSGGYIFECHTASCSWGPGGQCIVCFCFNEGGWCDYGDGFVIPARRHLAAVSAGR